MSDESPALAESASDKAAESLLGLPLRFESTFDAESDETLFFVSSNMSKAQALAEHVETKVAQYWTLLVPCYLALALGIYGSIVAERFLTATMISTVLVFLANQQRIINNNIRNQRFPDVVIQKLAFVVTAAGISEDDRGVESKCPWSAMNRWVLCRATLLIELSNGKWAVMSAKDLVPFGVKLENLCSLLKIKGVPGRNLDLAP
jgi:hypothetical protein